VTIATARDRLRPGGKLLIQMLNYSAQCNQQPRHRVEKKRLVDRDIMAVKSLVPCGNRTFLSLAFFTMGDAPTAEMAESVILMHLSAHELQRVGQSLGFAQIALYGSYSREVYDPETSGDLIGLFIT
jgi:hypothetical protein